MMTQFLQSRTNRLHTRNVLLQACVQGGTLQLLPAIDWTNNDLAICTVINGHSS